MLANMYKSFGLDNYGVFIRQQMDEIDLSRISKGNYLAIISSTLSTEGAVKTPTINVARDHSRPASWYKTVNAASNPPYEECMKNKEHINRERRCDEVRFPD